MKTLTDHRVGAVEDEAGTAPGDRKFRPDVQGLRAVAILLVVFYHADIAGFRGGYVGVDVFFVISGFVITGVLLRERTATGSTSILAFYGRRARRILPAATLVIVVTVATAYVALGSVAGHTTAIDGRWAAVFLANFHFTASATNYLASTSLPSPLQNYWSLAVEEQFYLIYPALFLIVAGLANRISLRSRISILLGATVVGSFAYSVLSTSSNAPSAYFSPLTRAWELALGGLVAVSSDTLRRVPSPLAAAISWLGVGGIVLAAVGFSSTTAYPGSLVAVPVVGAAFVIAGGTAHPPRGAETLLRLRPFQLLGLISYSLYLWHWPILIIAAEYYGKASLSAFDNALLIVVALGLATVTYLVVENPIRHWNVLLARSFATSAMACCLVGSSVVVTTYVMGHSKQPVKGSIASAAPGSICHTPSKSVVDSVRSAFPSGHSPSKGARVSAGYRMVVVGDSTACTLLPGLIAVGQSYGMTVINATLLGCGVVSGSLAYYSGGINLLGFTKNCQHEAIHTEDAAMAGGKPSIVLWGSSDEQSSIIVDTPTGSKILTSGSSPWRRVMLQRMDSRVRQFTATGAKVILLLEPPASHQAHSTGPTPTDLAYERMNALLRQVASSNRGHVGLVNLDARICPTGPPCHFLVDGIWVRGDGVHYYPKTSVWVARWLIPQILSSAGKLS